MPHHIARTAIAIRRLLLALALSLTFTGSALAQAQTEEQARAEVAQRREAVDALDRDADPVAWGIAQSQLGASLHRLWDFDSVQEAVAAYRAALEVLTPENDPANWLAAQEGLGQALLDIARRQSLATFLNVIGDPGGARIDPGLDARDAALAFAEVLRVRTRQGDRLGWARTQTSFGDALSLLATMQRLAAQDSERIAAFQAAAEGAYLEALDTLSPRHEPLERALVNNSLSSLYDGMARMTGGYAEDETAFRRMDTERIRHIRRAIRTARAAEREFQRAGRDDLAQEARERIDRLRERLRPNNYPLWSD